MAPEKERLQIQMTYQLDWQTTWAKSGQALVFIPGL
jgi:hypothetical protein